MPFYFGGTSLLIIVVVIMDFMAQLQAHLMSHQYEGLMKKANLRGYGAGRTSKAALECSDESPNIGSARSAGTARSCAAAAWCA